MVRQWSTRWCADGAEPVASAIHLCSTSACCAAATRTASLLLVALGESSGRLVRGDVAAQRDIDIYRLREPVFLGWASAAQHRGPPAPSALTHAPPAATVAAATHRGRKPRGATTFRLSGGGRSHRLGLLASGAVDVQA